MDDAVAIGLGSNLPDRLSNLRWAVDRLAHSARTRIERVSSVYETAAVGAPGHGPYLNAACIIKTDLDPVSLLTFCRMLEHQRGRTEKDRSSPRALDVDILLWGRRTIESRVLTVPHRRMCTRAFVLFPMSEIAPEMIHPMAGMTMREMRASIPAGHPAITRIEHRLVMC